MINQKLFKSALAATLATSAIIMVAPAAEAKTKFKDVSDTAEYAAALQDLVKRGIISGYEDGTFKPAAEVKRGHIAKILAGLLELDTKNVEDPEFTDIKPTNEYYGAIAALANAGIISGYADGTFGANRAITREQLARILTNAYDLHDDEIEYNMPFNDIDKYSEAYYNVGPLYKNNIAKGKTATTFGLKDTLTRSQLVRFISRLEAYQKSRVIETFNAKDLKVEELDISTYNNWSDDAEKEIFNIYYNEQKISVEALHEGKGYFVLTGYNYSKDGDYVEVFATKYNVTITKVDGKLHMTLEETTELTPGTTLLLEGDLGFEPKTIKLETKDGFAVSDKVYSYKPYDFKGWEEEDIPEGKAYELTINEVGNYIATVSDGAGKTARIGISAKESDYEINLVEAIEQSEIFIPTSDIGFVVKEYKVEEYTGALLDEKVLNITHNAEGVTVKRAANGEALFSIRLIGENGQKMYLHGLIFSISGVTSINHYLATQEEMDQSFFE